MRRSINWRGDATGGEEGREDGFDFCRVFLRGEINGSCILLASLDQRRRTILFAGVSRALDVLEINAHKGLSSSTLNRGHCSCVNWLTLAKKIGKLLPLRLSE